MTKLYWVGSSKDDLCSFPEEIRAEAGHDLYLVQSGLDPRRWKPMKIVGKGVREIIEDDHSGWYRVFYVMANGDALYVLHAFQKKSNQTSQKDIALGQARFKLLGIKS